MGRKSNRPATGTVEPSYAGRSTFRVSKALEQARRELPDTLFTKGDKPRDNRPAVDPVSLRDDHILDRARAASEPVKRKRSAPQERGVNLEKSARPDSCKGKPETTKRRGNGAGRSFVPWCK